MTDLGLAIAQLQRQVAELVRQSRLSSASLDDTALMVRDGGGSLRGIVGQQGDGTTAVNIVNGGPPPAPSTPTAAPALGGVSAGWDGTFADGEIIPLDWARVEVHASPTAAFTPAPETLQATIETAQGGIVYIPSAVPLYVALLARNTSGAASAATSEVGPYAPKPVAGEIGIGEITETLLADGSVTTPKVFANAITTSKLSAGSVDATALKADAITGKIITGGTINGAEFHSDNGAGGTVDIQDGSVTATGANGWKIQLAPNVSLPTIGFLDSEGDEAGSLFGNGNDALPNMGVASGPFTDPVLGACRWLTTMGTTSVGNRVWTRRTTSATLLQVTGGETMIDDDASRIAFIDTADFSRNTFLSIYANHADLYDARLTIKAPPSTFSALYVSAETGHTGALLLAQFEGANRFTVTTAGAATAAASVTAPAITATGTLTGNTLAITDTTYTTYTPTVAGGGTATFTSRTGWYHKIGKMVFFSAQFVVNAAGSGAAAVTITAPSSIHRTTRQIFPCHSQSTTTAGAVMNGHAISLETGTGTVIDRISLSNDGASNRDNILNGTNLLAGAQVSLSGWYREA